MAKQNDISKLPIIAPTRYENIFDVYQTTDGSGYYYYNLSRRVNLDIETIDPTFLDYYICNGEQPLTTISYRLYGTMDLWWLIVSLNQLNPINNVAAGTALAFIKPEYINSVVEAVNT
jgi:hypothetical protein